MSTNIEKRKCNWYRIKLMTRIECLSGEELESELEKSITEIKTKKLDSNRFFKSFCDQLEQQLVELKTKQKAKVRQYDPFHIPRAGDGRVILFGLSNVGKSSLMNAITNVNAKIGNYLHTTRTAIAGTCEINQLKIQIIDVPGFLDFKEDWLIRRQIVRVARTCDAILLVIDLSMNIERQYSFLMRQLEEARLLNDENQSFKLGIIATKGDLLGSKQNYALLSTRTAIPIHPITLKDQQSLENLKQYIFSVLDLIRVYTKPPRKEPDLSTPVICPIGTTIEEFAEKIHKDFIRQFRYARIWGISADFPGQNVGLTHELKDSDIVEIIINNN